MPHSVSARKRVRQNEKHRLANKASMSRLRTETKKLAQSIEGGDLGKAETQLRLVTKLLDKASKSSVLHKNNAARQKANLQLRLNAAKAAPKS